MTAHDSTDPNETLPVRVDPDAAPSAISSSETALEIPDALTAYMAQLRHHPPISREEEHRLAVRMVEEGDIEAARTLVHSNLRLVVKIAMEYRRAWTNVLDLIQEGNVGLLQAVRRFDPYKGVKLSSYAVYWIRAYILKYLIDNIRLVRMGASRAERKLFFRINKEKRELERQGYAVEPRLLAERLDVSERDVLDMETRLGNPETSMEAPVRRDDGRATFGDFLSGNEESVEGALGNAELRRVFLEKVKGFVADLNERERTIIQARILAEEPKTLQELGDEFGVTRERVRQIEAAVVRRLREYLKQNLVDFEYYAPPKD